MEIYPFVLEDLLDQKVFYYRNNVSPIYIQQNILTRKFSLAFSYDAKSIKKKIDSIWLYLCINPVSNLIIFFVILR